MVLNLRNHAILCINIQLFEPQSLLPLTYYYAKTNSCIALISQIRLNLWLYFTHTKPQ